jgi:hypothetical protein
MQMDFLTMFIIFLAGAFSERYFGEFFREFGRKSSTQKILLKEQIMKSLK